VFYIGQLISVAEKLPERQHSFSEYMAKRMQHFPSKEAMAENLLNLVHQPSDPNKLCMHLDT
jgi:hypothetical protein